MQKKKVNKLARSYEVMLKDSGGIRANIKGHMQLAQLQKNRTKRIDAWKNNRS